MGTWAGMGWGSKVGDATENRYPHTHTQTLPCRESTRLPAGVGARVREREWFMWQKKDKLKWGGVMAELRDKKNQRREDFKRQPHHATSQQGGSQSGRWHGLLKTC
eukprot:TRINITY_DN8877_c0_g1_i5.p2 TRINITY_DN8877_c0_g1~~TRINITY_DN8877_c0_g1_i5.p2  ORF type:complete len:106 (-),score=7.38 TRINITY_DN8877_c0_g1_i5:868-1185(-)